jgi:hypothetical protein
VIARDALNRYLRPGAGRPDVEPPMSSARSSSGASSTRRSVARGPGSVSAR